MIPALLRLNSLRRIASRGIGTPQLLCDYQLCLQALLCALFTLTISSQQPATIRGTFHYAVEDRDREQVVRRGTAGSIGIAFDQLLLAAKTRYRVWLLEATTLRVAEINFTTGDNGSLLRLPPFALQDQSSHDTDRDDLPDLGEFIIGTNPFNPDTDGDGVPDGAEVRQGIDPLSGRAVRTGIIGSAQLPGNSIDVTTINDLAIVANGDRGVSVLNIFNGMKPVLISQIETPGNALAVSASGTRIAVADGSAGLAIIDFSDPPNASIISQLNLGGETRSVALVGGMIYVGLRNGHLVAIELTTGAEQQRLPLGGHVFDLFPSGDHLFAIAGNRLRSFRMTAGLLNPIGDLALASLNEDPVTGRKRLFVGGGIAYASNGNGYDTVNVTNPASMQIIGRTVTTGPASFKQIVLNGSGSGLAPVGAQPRGDQHLSLYRTTNPTNTTDFITTFPTPGIASAVSIYNGLAYVADAASGLQVVNYLAYDTGTLAPTIAPSSDANAGQAEEGQYLRVTAAVTDDVQVRNVEFYLDGNRLVTDGNFPFEQRILLPIRAAGRESVRIQARASDTGGNLTWSDELLLALRPDATAPRVIRTVPLASSLSGSISNILAVFSEPLNGPTVNSSSLRLTHAGLDGVFGTPDDAPVLGGTLAYQESLNAAVLQFSTNLPPGNYRASVGAPISDRTGNVMPDTFSWSFRVFDRIDNDRDGVPDELESSLGLDPTKTDTNGNGIPDGAEDLDNDTLPTAFEIFYALDPAKSDSDANGIADANEDPDRDFLTNLNEFRNGTDPLRADTDSDGWLDEVEVSGGSDPLNPASRPRLFVTSRPSVSLAAVRLDSAIQAGTVIARPPVQLYQLSLTAPGAVSPGSIIARPPVNLIRPAIVIDALNNGTTIGKPPVQIQIGP